MPRSTGDAGSPLRQLAPRPPDLDVGVPGRRVGRAGGVVADAAGRQPFERHPAAVRQHNAVELVLDQLAQQHAGEEQTSQGSSVRCVTSACFPNGDFIGIFHSLPLLGIFHFTSEALVSVSQLSTSPDPSPKTMSPPFPSNTKVEVDLAVATVSSRDSRPFLLPTVISPSPHSLLYSYIHSILSPHHLTTSYPGSFDKTVWSITSISIHHFFLHSCNYIINFVFVRVIQYHTLLFYAYPSEKPSESVNDHDVGLLLYAFYHESVVIFLRPTENVALRLASLPT